MDQLLQAMTETALFEWEQVLSGWITVPALAILGIEIVRYSLNEALTWSLAGDAIASFSTFVLYLAISSVTYGVIYVAAFFIFDRFALFEISINWVTVAICVVLADLIYYWEHRFLHRAGIGWATHTVHHSSPHFNISVAFRFGPMDDVWSVLFHLPLVFLGFNPFVVLFASAFVQLYQTTLHTETIRKLPKFIETILNTPSHHRVHHGSNDQYMDKNYGGIFIIWDRMFGTFAQEKEKVIYGITRPLNSVNPMIVFFHGLTRLWRQLRDAEGLPDKLMLLTKPPGWQPISDKRLPAIATEGTSR